ncbi:MAG: tRNA (adenosine(37)-N6)-dimethylallyltransferase MiaA, partial [Porticoccaceae bacterium]
TVGVLSQEQVNGCVNFGVALVMAEVATDYHTIDIEMPASSLLQVLGAAKEIERIVISRIPEFLILEGLSDLPEADQGVRDEIQRRADEFGWPSLYDELQQIDPQTAKKLHPNHSQRIQRALEVYQLTGMSMSALQAAVTNNGVLDHYKVVQFSLVFNDRALLHRRIEQRFEKMMTGGLLAEVNDLHMRDDLHPDLPSMRAAGYQQIWQHLEGHCSLEVAVEKSIIASRQLAKRQITWLRNWPEANEICVDTIETNTSTENSCNECLKILGQHSIL